MLHIPRPHLTLLGRIVLFLVAFSASLLIQMGIDSYQTQYVIEPMERRTEGIQAISQFLNDVENCMRLLDDYRWDYGDTATLIAAIRQYQSASRIHLVDIPADIPSRIENCTNSSK